jgi:hypothetical protein
MAYEIWEVLSFIQLRNFFLPVLSLKNVRVYTFRSRDSSVSIATGYGLDDRGGGSSSTRRVKNFHFSISSRPALGSTQPILNGYGGLLPGGKAAGA